LADRDEGVGKAAEQRPVAADSPCEAMFSVEAGEIDLIDGNP